MDWFTADTHFGHNNIIRYCNRPFTSTEGMDAVLTRNWNEIVAPNDTVYFLGDLCFKNWKKLPRLNGRIVLIRGNHDGSGNVKRFVRAGLVAEVYRYHIYGDWILSHVPMWTHEKLLCGHIHCQWKVQRNTVNVGVDVWDFRPVIMDQIQERLEKQEVQ